MDLKTILYHGRIQLLRVVVDGLGQNRVAKGLTAFDDGDSNWGECFFARAFKGELDFTDRTIFFNDHQIETAIMAATGIKTKVPIRFTWQAFDNAKTTGINRQQLQKFLRELMVEKDLESLSLSDLESNPLINVPTFDEEKEVNLVCG